MDFNFACTACGKCCNAPPMFYLPELMEQAENFVILMQFAPLFLLDPAKKDHVKAATSTYTKKIGPTSRGAVISSMRLHQDIGKENGWRVPVPVNGLRCYMVPSFVDVAVGDKRCPKLQDDGLCQIHQGRPHICKLVPFGSNRSEAMNAETISSQTEKFVKQSGWKCDLSTSAPAVIQKGKIVDQEIRKAHKMAHFAPLQWTAGISAKAITMNSLGALAGLSGRDPMDIIETSVEAASVGGSKFYDLSSLARGLAMEGLSGVELAGDIIVKQIGVIDRRLNEEANGHQGELPALTIALPGETRTDSYLRLREIYEILLLELVEISQDYLEDDEDEDLEDITA